MSDTDRLLLEAARMVRERAYAPYSGFRVGAALLAADGRIFAGCNVENAAYPAGMCAERVALGRAVAEGAREFRAIALAVDAPVVCTPCGLCRQALFEFGGDLRVIMSNGRGDVRTSTLGELLPAGFGPHHLGKGALDAPRGDAKGASGADTQEAGEGT